MRRMAQMLAACALGAVAAACASSWQVPAADPTDDDCRAYVDHQLRAGGVRNGTVEHDGSSTHAICAARARQLTGAQSPAAGACD